MTFMEVREFGILPMPSVLRSEQAPLPQVACRSETAELFHEFVEQCQVAAVVLPHSGEQVSLGLLCSLRLSSPPEPLLQAARALLIWVFAKAVCSSTKSLAHFQCCAGLLRQVSTESSAEHLAEKRLLSGSVDSRVAQALSVIEQTYASASLNESRVARQVGLSPSRLGRVFRSATGVGFRQHVKLSRILHALDHLANTSMLVTTIAAEVGYSHVSSFDRDFRSVLGMTPLAFRHCVRRTAADFVATFLRFPPR